MNIEQLNEAHKLSKSLNHLKTIKQEVEKSRNHRIKVWCASTETTYDMEMTAQDLTAYLEIKISTYRAMLNELGVTE